MAGPPDSGVIVTVLQSTMMAGGLPLATVGSICQMVNSVSGAPYPLPIGPGGSPAIIVAGQPLVRVGDVIPSGPGLLTILGPPAAPFLSDTSA
jgi:hypothetical protein